MHLMAFTRFPTPPLCWCFLVRSESLLSRPDLTLRAAEQNEGEERSGATRSHAQRALPREHGEDGEHRTFPVVSTAAQ